MIKRADLQWAWHRLKDTLAREFLLPSKSLPTSTPNRYERVAVEKNVPIPMRDGVRLYANVFRPEAEGPFPVVLIRMPYGKDEFYCYMPAFGKYWARKGYACVTQDVRGKWCSEGQWQPFVNEGDDGWDTLDWIAAQPWCDGNIGMMGESYFGYTQWAAAVRNHPNLKAIIPGVTAADIHGVWVYNGGAFCLQTLGRWVYAMDARRWQNYLRLNYWHLPLVSLPDEAGGVCEMFKDWIRHPQRDGYWDDINVDDQYDQIQIPVLQVGGWYDVFLKGTLDDYKGVRDQAAPLARQRQRLLIGPLDHDYIPATTHRIGRLDVGEQAWDWDRYQRFFDRWLKGVDNGLEETPPVEIFVLGDNVWRYEDEWPLARTEYTKYYFHSDGSARRLASGGTLDASPPGEEPSDQYVYDPDDPVTVTMDQWLWDLSTELEDRTPVEERKDVLTFTSAPLQQELEVTGPLAVTLYAASSACDTDFTAALVDVFPDGYAQLVQEGILRASYREPGGGRTLLEPDQVYELTIDLWATSYVFKEGHRLRVEISSSNFNRYDRNPNTGDLPALAERVIKATQTVYHDGERASCITLPVIPRR